MTMTKNPVAWLVAGLGCLAAGAAVGLLAAAEAGVALALLGAAALGAAAALAAASRVAELALIAEAEQSLAAQREVRREEVQRRWLTDGVSPTEQAYEALMNAAAEDAAAAPGSLNATERRLGELIKDRCDRVWEGIHTRRYVRQQKDRKQKDRITGLDGGALYAEFRDIVQEVAAVYNPGATNAVLDARTGDIALAIRGIIGELLQVVRQVPFVDPAGWSVREIVTQLERAEKARHLYRKLTPYEHYFTAVIWAAGLATGANAVTLVARKAAMDVAGKVLKTYAEAWLKELLESSVALVYLRVARTYDPQQTYRSADWIALAEALRIHNQIPGIDHNRQHLLDRILRAQIPDEFAKMALLRALAADAEPAAESGPPLDLAALPAGQRRAIAARLGELLPALRGLNEPQASEAIEELERRLGTGLQVALVRGGSRAEVCAEEGFAQLAVATHDWCGLDHDTALEALAGSPFAAAARKAVGNDDAVQNILEQSLSAAYSNGDSGGAQRLVEPPRDLVGDPLARPLVTTLVELLTQRAPAGWPVEHDHMVLLNASVLLEKKRLAAVWKDYLQALSKRLGGLLKCPTPSTWPPASTPAILRAIGQPDVTPPPNSRTPVAVFEAQNDAKRKRWLLLFADRSAVVGRVPDDEIAIDEGDAKSYAGTAVRFTRKKGLVADDLVVRCGDERLAIAGNPLKQGVRSFKPRFHAVLDHLGLPFDALDES